MRFRAALDDIYGPRIERVVLFGSHARGDARPESDCADCEMLDGFDLDVH
jgi:predicted nucleotidyltransferase